MARYEVELHPDAAPDAQGVYDMIFEGSLIDEAWRAEVHRRRLRRKNGETQAQPWEEVEAELMSL